MSISRKISVKSHKHATKNPFSQYRNEVTLEDVLNARMVAFPNTLYMCCPTGDGAAAAILVSEDKLKQYADGRKRARVAASVLTSDPYTERDLTLPDVSTLTRRAAKKAYETAGIGPQDVSLTELHDCFATAELVHYENLGLCGDGEAGKFIDEGGGMHPGLGGKAPVNVSGGLLSKGHPLGATGVANICEVVWHLTQDDRGEGSAGAEREGRHGPRYRTRLGLHDSSADGISCGLRVWLPLIYWGRSWAAPFSYPMAALGFPDRVGDRAIPPAWRSETALHPMPRRAAEAKLK